jgi:DNA ligase D-like protein (predicted ligase)
MAEASMIPTFPPMLAVSGDPFDSNEHLFEVKWDGVRALACVENHQWRLWGREEADYTDRYPELDALLRMPTGTVLDGELVVLRESRAELSAILRRHQLTSARKIKQAIRQLPVTYILFDCLYHQGHALLDQPLSARRKVLAELLECTRGSPLAFSDGVIGSGEKFFDQVVEQGHEGVMAKQLNSPYLPARRAPTWRKIKPRLTTVCVIIGYTPGREGFSSLLVAALRENTLGYVGQLTCGFTKQQRTQLASALVKNRCTQPAVACPKRAIWVTPRLYCEVRFLAWTANGRLRGASFGRLIDTDE